MSTPNPTLNDQSVATGGLPAVDPTRVRTHLSSLAQIARALKAETADLHLRLTLANLLISLLPSHSFSRVRTTLYRFAGLSIGPRSLIFGRIEFTGSGALHTRLRIGSDTIVNCHCFADLNAEIVIGDRVSIGHHVTFITADHEVGPSACRAGLIKPAAISIGDGTWIGARATMLPGCEVGKSSVIAAGSLVSGKIPANRLVGGVPARALRTLASEP